eukprot:1790881-Rhodomonas_salina.1
MSRPVHSLARRRQRPPQEQPRPLSSSRIAQSPRPCCTARSGRRRTSRPDLPQTELGSCTPTCLLRKQDAVCLHSTLRASFHREK